MREGIPEEEILRYSKEYRPRIVIMGTRGKNQKDIDLIGSVTAEVIERSRVPVLAIPENTPFKQLAEAKRIAFITNFDQRDLIAFDSLIAALKPFHFSVSLIHLSDVKDTWNEIKLGGIKEYFQKQYPDLEIHYDVVMNDDFLNSLDNYIKTNPKYKSKYYNTGYPNDEYGVCTDVVAFALKDAGYDLMVLVNEDIKNNKELYDIDAVDKNIDFRRVKNLKVYFDNNAISLTTDINEIEEWQGGDIVVFKKHIGIISDKRNRKGICFVIHHANPYQIYYEEDILEHRDDIIGHYRIS